VPLTRDRSDQRNSEPGLGKSFASASASCHKLFGPAVQVYTAMHPMDAELRRKQEYAKPIEIGSDVWVGGGAIICPGVKFGSKTVIEAGSVVTRDIPAGEPGSGVAGHSNPSLPSVQRSVSGGSRDIR
jgi:UDP-3-O-[3-hydroxymyristoyl] glucosamine N-acyltransferase